MEIETVTFDPYTNRVPLGLLTDDERAALQAEGPWEFFSAYNDAWKRAGDPTIWHREFIYRRARPALTHDTTAWDVVDKRWKYQARDENGMIWLFKEKPFHCSFCWLGRGICVDTTIIPAITAGTCDWKDSLQIRPGVEDEQD